MERSKNLNLFQMAYLILAGFCLLSTIVSFINQSGSRVYYLTYGLVYTLVALFFTTMVSNDKIGLMDNQLENAASGLQPLLNSIELISFFSKITNLIVPLYLAIQAYYLFSIGKIVNKIPLIGSVIAGTLSSLNGILYLLFLLSLFILFANRKFSTLATYLGLYILICAARLVYYFFSGSYFSSASNLMFFGFAFCVFYPYLKGNQTQ